MCENAQLYLSIANLLVLTISAFFIYRQIKAATKANQLESIITLHRKLTEINELCDPLCETAVEFALTQDQFPATPPSKHKIYSLPDYVSEKMEMSQKQKAAFGKVDPKTFETARKAIAKLNELGQLLEDGLINYNSFLGIYHSHVIRACSALEPYRRKFEKEMRLGGNYGHRLLRMRHKAILYNLAYPKHRCKDIYIYSENDTVIVYRSSKVTKISCFGYKIRLFLYKRW